MKILHKNPGHLFFSNDIVVCQRDKGLQKFTTAYSAGCYRIANDQDCVEYPRECLGSVQYGQKLDQTLGTFSPILYNT